MKTIKSCEAITTQNGNKQLIALYSDGTIEEIGYSIPGVDFYDAFCAKFIGLTESEARRLFYSRF